jgi:hypothetical protein
MPICGAGADTYKSMLTSVPAFDRAAEHRQNRTKLTFRAIQQRVVTALFRRGAQDPSKVDRLKGTTQRIGRVSSSHLAATNHRAGMSHCCDLPHCDIPAPSPAPALEATSSAVLCPIVLLSARAAGHVRNYRPRLVGTSPTNRSGRSELITSRPAEVTTEAAIERRHVRQQDAAKVHRRSSPNDAKAE